MWLDVDDEPVAGTFDLALAAAADTEPGTVVVFDYRYHWKWAAWSTTRRHLASKTC